MMEVPLDAASFASDITKYVEEVSSDQSD